MSDEYDQGYDKGYDEGRDSKVGEVNDLQSLLEDAESNVDRLKDLITEAWNRM